MITRDRLRCGGCGHGTFSLEHAGPLDGVRVGGHGDNGFPGMIVTICTSCGEESEVESTPASLRVDGTLCGGWAAGYKERDGK